MEDPPPQISTVNPSAIPKATASDTDIVVTGGYFDVEGGITVVLSCTGSLCVDYPDQMGTVKDLEENRFTVTFETLSSTYNAGTSEIPWLLPLVLHRRH